MGAFDNNFGNMNNDIFGNMNLNQNVLMPNNYDMKCKIIRSIDNIDDISLNEVPMDGSWGIFILKDLSKIYFVSWSLDGIKRMEFDHIEPTKETEKKQEIDVEALIDRKMKELEDKLPGLISKQMKQRYANKKEVKNNA